MTAPLPSIDALAIGPVGIVALFGLFCLILEVIRPKSNNNLIASVCGVGLLASAALVVYDFAQPAASTFGGMELHDGLGGAISLLLILTAFITLLISEPYLREKKIAYGEFYPLMMWSAAGGMIMATSTNLLVIFLGLEILSISLYVLSGLSRQEEKSEESAVKYFLLGAFSSGFFLYGIALIYGATGSLDLGAVPGVWDSGLLTARLLLIGGLAFAAVGMCFKTGMVPFHQWAPDVYQGAPTNVTAFMSSAAKVGAFAVMWRLFGAFAGSVSFWMAPLYAVAVLTMLGGNILAFIQTDVKRMLAYSSVSHAGYILVDVLAHAKNPEVGYANMIFYLLSYTLMTVGAFAVLTLLASRGKESTKITDLNGLWKRNPIAAVSLLVFMLSLVGLPPFSGFFGKVLIFSDAVGSGLTSLAIVLGISSIISAGYYLNIARAAFVEEPSEETPHRFAPTGLKVVCVACAIGVVAISVCIGPIQSALIH